MFVLFLISLLNSVGVQFEVKEYVCEIQLLSHRKVIEILSHVACTFRKYISTIFNRRYIIGELELDELLISLIQVVDPFRDLFKIIFYPVYELIGVRGSWASQT